MNNHNTNRMNPLIVTNVLLAVIAGCLMWNIVGPSVEPQAQAQAPTQAEEEMKTFAEWYNYFRWETAIDSFAILNRVRFVEKPWPKEPMTAKQFIDSLPLTYEMKEEQRETEQLERVRQERAELNEAPRWEELLEILEEIKRNTDRIR